MSKIQVLDFHVANLIAAGEVVDRPASVVKELLENAIDAGATAVTVEIKRGGVSFIRVTDNGCGMAREDVPIALKRHATSKIRQAEDLDSIATLGFRGEAMAAIAAVSKLRILTKRREDAVGTVLESAGGRVSSVSDAGCPDGTTVIVEELFYNTPARLKFLKKDGTEASNVAAYVEKIALSHPEIILRFISDGELKYATTGDGNKHTAIYAVLGRDFAKKLTEIYGGFDGVEVTGYIGTPENVRGNRNMQIFFINNRFIRSKTVSAALEQAYATFIPQDKFPCAVLYLHMNPNTVDVNVHPAKLEVKFANDRTVFESVYYAVRGALENRLSRPEFNLSPKKQAEQAARAMAGGFAPVKEGRGGEKGPTVQEMRQTVSDGVAQASPLVPPVSRDPRSASAPSSAPPPASGASAVPLGNAMTKGSTPSVPKALQDAGGTGTLQLPMATDPGDLYVSVPRVDSLSEGTPSTPMMPPRMAEGGSMGTERPVVGAPTALPTAEASFVPGIQQNTDLPAASAAERGVQTPAYRILGEAFRCYVICECEDTLYFIDKHAAHERILFESFKACARQSESTTQMLLMPLTVTLTDEEAEAAREYEADIVSSGYSFTLEGREASITRIPSFLGTGAAMDAFCEACARLADNTGTADLTRQSRFEAALFSASCKAAIKGGRIYDTEHLAWICDRVLANPEIRYCPHGRPVCFTVTKAQFEGRFGRT